MNGKLLIKLIKFCFNESFRLSVLVLAVSLLGISCAISQAGKTPGSQENENEQPPKDQQSIEKRETNDEKMLPFFVSDCNDKNKWIHEEVKFPANLYNPNFVRGDFDGDGNNDYAIIVESRKHKREGILVCFRNQENKAVLLGRDINNPPQFWRLRDWDVFTPREVSETIDYKGNPVGVKPKGESLVMIWEDAIGIIYWNGKGFQWKQVILNDGN